MTRTASPLGRLPTRLPVLLAAAAAGAGAAHADRGIAAGASLGTTGGTVEVTAQMTPYVQLRGGFNSFQYSIDDTFDDVAYDGDLDLSTFGAFLDFRPWGNAFLVSGGAFIGDKTLDMSARPTGNTRIGDVTYTPAQLGQLSLDAEMENVAPFVGLGWDTTFQGDSPIGFKLLVGAMFTGTPSVNLTASGGTLSNDPAFQAEVAKEERNLQDDVNDFEVYPVAQIGLTFRF
jgi:hypothetical protein